MYNLSTKNSLMGDIVTLLQFSLFRSFSTALCTGLLPVIFLLATDWHIFTFLPCSCRALSPEMQSSHHYRQSCYKQLVNLPVVSHVDLMTANSEYSNVVVFNSCKAGQFLCRASIFLTAVQMFQLHTQFEMCNSSDQLSL